MRIIEEKMIAAINANDQFNMDNTALRYTTGNSGFSKPQVEVLLHGHSIATLNEERTAMTFSLCGYNTRTTRSRINALLQSFKQSGAGVSTRKGVVYLRIDGRERAIESTGTYFVGL
jgi:hypothetical protein